MDNLRKMLAGKGLQLLDLAAPDWLPGHLLKVTYVGGFLWWGKQPRLDEDHGLATNILRMSALTLDPQEPSNIVLESVTDSFSADASVGIPQFGLNLENSLTRNVSVTWNISSIETVALADAEVQRYYQAVLPAIRQYAKADTSRLWILDCFLVSEVYFVSGLTGTVKDSGGLSGKTLFNIHGITVQPNLALSWADEHTFTIQGCNNVPFACKGDFVRS